MADSRSTALAASLVGGYLLGRGGKTQAALGIAAYLAGKKLLSHRASSDDGREAESQERSSPLRRLGQKARGEFLNAGVAALTGAVNRQMDHVADLIESRSHELSDDSANESEQQRAESDAAPSSGDDADGEADEEAGSGRTRQDGGQSESGQREGKRGSAQRAHSTATRPTPPTPSTPTDSSAKGSSA